MVLMYVTLIRVVQQRAAVGDDLQRRQQPAVRVLVLSMHDEMLYAERLLAMGAHGYVMKQESPEVFLVALRKVSAGEHFVTAAVGSRLFGKLARFVVVEDRKSVV